MGVIHLHRKAVSRELVAAGRRRAAAWARVCEYAPVRFKCVCGCETFWALTEARLMCSDWEHCGRVWRSMDLERRAALLGPGGGEGRRAARAASRGPW